MRRVYKNLISLCAVLIFSLALLSINAFADPFAGAVTAGLGAMYVDIAVSGTNAATFSDYMTGVPSSDPISDWTDSAGDFYVYYKRHAKTVQESGVDVDYDLLWYSPDFVSHIQNYGIDFIQDKSIVSNSQGTLAYGVGHIDGVPIYNTGENYYYSQPVSIPYAAGTYYFSDSVDIKLTPYQNMMKVSVEGANGVSYVLGNNTYDMFPKLYRYRVNQAWNSINVQHKPANQSSYSIVQYWPYNLDSTYPQDQNSFTFSYVSGVIDATLTDKGLEFYVPSNSMPSDITDGYYNTSTQTGQEKILLLSDGVTSAAAINKINSPAWSDDPYIPPVPPTPPVPSDPLGEVPFDDWQDLFGLPVLEGEEQIHQDLQDFNDDVNDGLSDLGDQLDDANDTLGSIDTNIQTGNGLLGDLKTLGQNILSTLNSILSGVTDLVQEIVLSTETFIAGLLNSIMGGLGGWLSTMREAFSIWHYVVEWVGSISTVFSWFWSVAGSTSYYIQLPIYASIAGAVVLAFYKRFGK